MEVGSEEDVGLRSHTNTITLLRNGADSQKPSKITTGEIKEVIRNHVHKRRTIIQDDVTVAIIAGTFKDWFGKVEARTDNPENVRIKFTSDNYDYTTDMPTILCKATC